MPDGLIFTVSYCLIHLKNLQSILIKYVPKSFLLKLKPNLDISELQQPFIVSPNNFKSRVKVVYNAVGGSGLQYGEYSLKNYFHIINALNHAAYVLVGDKRTKNVLASLSKIL